MAGGSPSGPPRFALLSGPPPSPVAIAAVVAVALTAAAFLRVSAGPSVGWLLVGLVAAGFLAVLVRRTGEGSRERVWWLVAALALLAVGTVRAAGWLFLLCAPLAMVCGTVAITGGRTALGLLEAALALPAAAGRGLPWFAHGVRSAARGRGTGGVRWVIVGSVTVMLLVVFGGLFAAADPTFASMLSWAVPSPDSTDLIQTGVRLTVFAWGAIGAVYLARRPGALDRAATVPTRTVRRLEWLVPVALLDCLFALFVATQLRVYFGGEKYVLRTAGLTFAEYARKGFWQLSAITALTLAVIAVVVRVAARRSPADRRALRAGLGTLTGLALVVVVSALARMAAYEHAYGLTRLRVLVAAAEIALGVVLLLVLAAGIRLAGGWLPRAVLATAVLTLLALAALNPDRMIADRNIDRYARDGRLDGYYLTTLSADAAPAVQRLRGGRYGCVPYRHDRELRRHNDAWFEFNLGRALARAEPDIAPGPNC